MPATSIQSPFPIFTDIDGQPLEQGQVWLGTAGNNPISSPITAYWDAALTQVVTQPVTTRGGYPLNGTAVGRLYVNADFSILVRNRRGYDVLSALSATERFDSSLVTFVQAGLGAVTRTAQAKMRDIVSVKDFGAVGDGVADDTVALNTAFSKVGKSVYMPDGTYYYSANLNDALCAEITGSGISACTLKPGAAVTTALPLGNPAGYPTKIHGFTIDGSATTSSVGVFFGKTSSMAVSASDIYCKSFSGANAAGFRFGNVLKSNFFRLTAYQCQVGFLHQGVTGDFPTTLHLDSCVASDIDTYGELVKTGYQIEHTNCAFESCDTNGVYVNPTAADATEINYEACWFEANASNDPTKFHFIADTSTRTCRVHVKNCYFDTSAAGSNAKAIRLNGSGVAGFSLANPSFQGSYSQAISVENGAYGTIYSWLPAFGYSTIVYDPSGNVTTWWNIQSQLDAAWTAYTPTYASDIGNAAATFSGAVTTSLARYKRIGKTLFITISYSATLNSVTPSFISVSLPAGFSTQNSATYNPAVVRDNTYETGVVRTDGGGNLLFYRDAFATYSSGASVVGSASVTVELQ